MLHDSLHYCILLRAHLKFIKITEASIMQEQNIEMTNTGNGGKKNTSFFPLAAHKIAIGLNETVVDTFMGQRTDSLNTVETVWSFFDKDLKVEDGDVPSNDRDKKHKSILFDGIIPGLTLWGRPYGLVGGIPGSAIVSTMEARYETSPSPENDIALKVVNGVVALKTDLKQGLYNAPPIRRLRRKATPEQLQQYQDLWDSCKATLYYLTSFRTLTGIATLATTGNPQPLIDTWAFELQSDIHAAIGMPLMSIFISLQKQTSVVATKMQEMFALADEIENGKESLFAHIGKVIDDGEMTAIENEEPVVYMQSIETPHEDEQEDQSTMFAPSIAQEYMSDEQHDESNKIDIATLIENIKNYDISENAQKKIQRILADMLATGVTYVSGASLVAMMPNWLVGTVVAVLSGSVAYANMDKLKEIGTNFVGIKTFDNHQTQNKAVHTKDNDHER